MAVLAVQAIRRMRGGAQSQLMLGADGKLWVVKFQNNPQHLRVLANELIATRLAEAVGLTVPAMRCGRGDGVADRELRRRCTSSWRGAGGSRTGRGCSSESQFVGGLMPGQVVDYLPEQQLEEVRNLEEFAGMLCIDKWTGNCNGRQAVFERQAAGAEVSGDVHRPGVLLQCGGVDVSGLAAARGVCAEPGVRRGDGVGEL